MPAAITPCTCKTCQRFKNIRSITASRNFDELITLIYQLMDENVGMSEDLEYHKALLDGSWPESRGILMGALEKLDKENK